MSGSDAADQPDLLIVGASARAAAFSALRAGLTPRCIDLFADADLAVRCTATAVRPYPQGIVAAAQAGPLAPWIYTGGLENHPGVLRQIASLAPLLGNSAAVVERVRDPFLVAKKLRSAGQPVPHVRTFTDPPPANGTWMLKGIRSAGGSRVFIWNEDAQAIQREDHDWFFQERISGTPVAAIFLGNAQYAVLLGVTQQCLGEAWHPHKPFAYAGSIGPIDVAALAEPIAALGQTLAREFELRGVFGVDGVLNDDGFWPVEVNPRWTASLEVLERAGEFSAMPWHIAACRGESLPSPPNVPRGVCVGKAILYVAENTSVTDKLATELQQAASWPWPAVADLPAAGTSLEAGHPAFTLFATGTSVEDVAANLQQALAFWRSKIQVSG